MYYRAKKHSKKVAKRILRHKRVRYHNDAHLFPDDSTNDRKRRKSLKKRLRRIKDNSDLADL